jgi:hypothetical protein
MMYQTEPGLRNNTQIKISAMKFFLVNDAILFQVHVQIQENDLQLRELE